MTNADRADPAEIRRTLALLLEPDSVAELRILETGSPGTVSGYFTDWEKCAQAACKWSGKAPAVYITLNPCHTALLARAANRLAVRARQTTADHDILKRRWLPIDFDPRRPAGISSTDAEHDTALQRAFACREWLTAQGWPAPILADSGNGAHLLYRIDLPNDDAGRDLVKQCLEALALYHADDVVSLDVGVFNAARIWKLYGTRACKGEHLPERPHRRARLIDVPDVVLVVSRQQLEALAALVPSSPQSEPAHPTGRVSFDLPQWIAEHHLPVVATGSWGDGGRKWILNPCPWNGDHTNKAAYIVRFATGAIAAGCHHNGCAEKDWHALRDLCEPEWRTARSESSGSSRGVSSNTSPREAPRPLRRTPPPAEPYPTDALGPILAPMARCLVTVVQAPAALCGQSVLAAASLAVQGHANISQDALAALPPPPHPPLEPVCIAQEPTYEGLIRLFIHGQPSLGLFSDEGGRFIGGHGMEKDQLLKTAAGLSELWDGKAVSRVRAGDGAGLLYGRRFSLHLMVQPQVAYLVLGNSLLLDQGLLSRVLVAWPETTAGSRFYKAYDLTTDADVAAYNSRLAEILERPWALAENTRNELQPQAWRVEQAAKRLWIAFHDHIETQLAPGKELEPIRGFASKTPEHTLRLAGVLAGIEDITRTTIEKPHIEAGIALAEFYLSEALRLFATNNIDPDLLLAEQLLTWMSGQSVVHLAQIYQYGPHTLRDAKTARRIVTILEDHGWLRRVEGGREIDGTHRRDVWEVSCDAD
jgi:hypothetical protein